MRNWLNTAPRWALSVVMGVFFGVLMAGQSLLRGDSWSAAGIGGLVGGALFGAWMGPFVHRLRRRQREALGDIPPGRLRAARRAALRGPLPEDAETRAVTARLVGHQLAETGRRRVLTRITLAVLVGLYVVLAIARSPWWWLAVVFFGAMLASALWLPRHLRRRAALLRAHDRPDGAGGFARAD